MKMIQFSVTQQAIATGSIYPIGLCDIASGDGVFERSGNQIRVHRVEVRGHTSQLADIYLLNGPGGWIISPAYTDFSPNMGGCITANKSHEFKLIKQHWNTQGPIGNFFIVHRFKYPMVVEYAGDALNACCKNQLWLVIKNSVSPTTSINLDISCKVYYTDV